MKLAIASYLVFFGVHLSAHSQCEFSNVYSSSLEKSYGFDICVSPDSGFVVCGYVEKAGDRNMLVLKLDSSGAIEWQRSIGGDNLEQGRRVMIASDSSIYAVGWTRPSPAEPTNLLYSKIDFNGNLVWSKTLEGISSDHAWHIQEDFDSDKFVITGYTFSSSLGIVSNLIVRINSDGDTLLTKVFGGSEKDYGHSMVRTEDGYLFCGHSSSFGVPLGVENNDVLVYKLDSNFNVVWSKSYGLEGREEGNGIVRTSDSNFIVAGTTASYSTANKGFVLKIDSVGNVIWAKTIDLGSESEVLDLSINELDQICLVGFFVNSTNSVHVTRLDSDGDLISSHSIDGDSHERGYAVANTLNGAAICGYTSSFGLSAINLFVAKFDFSLMSICQSMAITPEIVNRSVSTWSGLNESPSSINNINILNDNYQPNLTGTSLCSVGFEDIDWINFNLYPVPTNGELWIQLNSTVSDASEIQISDLSGKVVMRTTLCFDSFNDKQRIDVSSLPNGCYNLDLISVSGIRTARKFIVSK